MKELFGVLGVVLFVPLLFALLIGWVYNLVDIFQTDLSTGATGQFVLQVVGIFVPIIGSICGWVL